MGQKISEIIPAIMPHGFTDMQECVERVVRAVHTVQLDIMDGKFVPSTTWPYKNPKHTLESDHYFQAIQREEAGLPLWEEIDYELDLMINDPEKTLSQWMTLGPSRIVLHIESSNDIREALTQLQETRDIVQVGLACDDDYDVNLFDQYVHLVDFVQMMGIDTIGKQGEQFDKHVLENIQFFRKKYPGLLISIDGSVNADTIEELFQAGANRFVVGSAIWEAENEVAMIRELSRMVQS